MSASSPALTSIAPIPVGSIQSNDHPHNFDAAVIAGITVGSVVFLALIATGVTLLLRRCFAKHRTAPSAEFRFMPATFYSRPASSPGMISPALTDDSTSHFLPVRGPFSDPLLEKIGASQRAMQELSYSGQSSRAV